MEKESFEIAATAEQAPKTLMRRKEVAAMAGVHTETVKRWEYKGVLPAVKINSRVTRYRAEDVHKLLNQK